MPPLRQNPQSHQYPFPAEYRGPPMAEGKDGHRTRDGAGWQRCS